MRVLNDFSFYCPRKEPGPLILALGNFDGAHLGHQELLRKVTSRAQARKGVAAVLTFLQHPQHILHPSAKPPLLTSIEHKLFLLEETGIDICFLMPFTPHFAAMEPETFVEDILYEKLRIAEIYLGYNARFGKDRRGDSALMGRLAGKWAFIYEELRPVKYDGELVSSSRVRRLVREGKLEEAAGCLGRRFGVMATVTRGSGRGKRLGFPTANLDVRSEIMPPLGVYPVKVREVEIKREIFPEGQGELFETERVSPWKPGILNYGYRPTFEGETPKAVPEVHLFDFDEDLYGKRLEVIFYERVRGEKAFESAEALRKQITGDIADVKKYFAYSYS